MDLGLFEGVVNVDVYNFLDSTGHYYDYYYYTAYYLGIFNLQVVYFPVVILQYGKLTVRQVKIAQL